jgi:hypothetical protein
VAQVHGELLQGQVFVVDDLRQEVVLAQEGADVFAEDLQFVEGKRSLKGYGPEDGLSANARIEPILKPGDVARLGRAALVMQEIPDLRPLGSLA